MSKSCFGLPDTSVTLLNDLGRSSETCRWEEFVRRYDHGLRSFLRTEWPNVYEDEVVQQTYLQLVRALPKYHYVNGQEKRFHNWLLTVVSNEAKKWIRKEKRHHKGGFSLDDDAIQKGEKQVSCEDSAKLSSQPKDFDADEVQAMRTDLALESCYQILKDDSIDERRREIFRLLSFDQASPEEVSTRFGITCNLVYRLKHDVMVKVRAHYKRELAAAGLEE